MGVENAAPDCRGGKRGSGKRGSPKSMESDDFKNVFLTVLTELAHRVETDSNVTAAQRWAE